MAKQGFTPVKPQWLHKIDDYVVGLSWSPDGSRLVAGGGEGTLNFLSGSNGQPQRQVEAHPNGLLSMAHSPDGLVVATGGQDRQARLWDAVSGAPLATLDSGGNSVEHLLWNRKRNLLAIASGKVASVWTPAGQLVQRFAPHGFTVGGIQWSPDGQRIASVAFDGLRLHTTDSPDALANHGGEVSVISLAWNPVQQLVVGGTQDASLLIWNIAEADSFQAGPFEVKLKELAWHYQGRWLVTGGGSDVTLWDFLTGDMQGQKPVFLEAHQELVTQLEWQRIGPLFASGGRDGAVYFWKPEASKVPLTYCHLEGEEITALAWHPRDNGVAVGTAEGTVAFVPAPDRR